MRKEHLLLYCFPVLEICAFVCALRLEEDHLPWSLFFLLLAAFLLNFTLHIAAHFHVHFLYKSKILNVIVDFFYSILLVFPFHLYKIQHYNHHRYNNLLGDFTSTWKKGVHFPEKRSFISYSFFWIFRKFSFKTMRDQAMKDGDLKRSWLSNIKIEMLYVVSFFGLLVWINPTFAFYYSALFYLGWSLIAMHNFGQHLPLNYGESIGFSFNNKLYNKLFFNNGLHFEHHLEPGKDYWSLKRKSKKVNRFPHLIDGFFIDLPRKK